MIDFCQSSNSIENSDDKFPEIIPGINVKKALIRLGGNKQLLRQLLRDFKRDFKNANTDIRAALDRHDIYVAQHLAHTLKGISGNIGADELYQVACELDLILRKGDNADFDTHLLRLEKKLTMILEAISAIEKSGDQDIDALHRESTPMDLPQVTLSMVELYDLLKTNDFKSFECFESLKENLKSEGPQQELILLEESLNKFDFETAQKALIEISRILSIPINGK